MNDTEKSKWWNKLPLTEEDEDFCRFWLKQAYRWRGGALDQPVFTEYKLGQMIQYELGHRKSATVLNALHSKICKLRRKREWTELLDERNIRDARERNRGLSRQEGTSHTGSGL